MFVVRGCEMTLYFVIILFSFLSSNFSEMQHFIEILVADFLTNLSVSALCGNL